MKKIYGILILLILCFWSVRALLIPGYFPMHDDTQIARVVVMGNALKQGQFPVRWVSGLGYGYGYPIFNFYAPLPYYIGGGLYAVGMDSISATKIMFFIGIILSAICMYILLAPVYGIMGALLGAVLLLYAPYHAVQVYIRGSVGEYWALSFIPVVVLGFRYVLESPFKIKGIVWGAIGLAGVIISHTILGFITTGLTIIGIVTYIFVSHVRKSKYIPQVYYLVLLLVFGLLLSSFFWLPAIIEMHYTSVASMITSSNSIFSDHFVCISQLWNSPWGYAGSASGCTNDGISFKLGKFHVLVAVGTVLYFGFRSYGKKIKFSSFLFTLGLIICLVSIFLMTSISSYIWDILPFTPFIQYPWRLLSYSIIAISLIGGSLGQIIQSTFWRRSLIGFLILCCIGINSKLFTPQYSYPRDAGAFESKEDIEFRVSKISDEYLPPGIVKPKNVSEINRDVIQASENMSVIILKKTDTYLSASIDTVKKGLITINTSDFPGWKYYVNFKPVTPIILHDLPSIAIAPGKSIIEARFTNTQIRSIGNILSVLALMLLGGGMYYESKKNT